MFVIIPLLSGSCFGALCPLTSEEAGLSFFSLCLLTSLGISFVICLAICNVICYIICCCLFFYLLCYLFCYFLLLFVLLFFCYCFIISLFVLLNILLFCVLRHLRRLISCYSQSCSRVFACIH